MNLKVKKFRVESVGCRVNQYEAQAIADGLKELGYLPAEKDMPADLCIVNSCSVTESADAHSRHLIRTLARQNPGCRLIVTGCFAARAKEEILAIDGVTDIVSNLEKEKILSLVIQDQMSLPEFQIHGFAEHTRAPVKVQDGCNSFCSYCIVPYVRGRSRSRPVDKIIQECQNLIANGFKEIVLTGINIGDFQIEKNKRGLVSLVRTLDSLPGLKRLRLSSIDADDVDDDLQQALLQGKTTCNSLHLVLQSGSNAILKAMRRTYSRQQFLARVRSLRAADPDFTFTTDVIVGFPGEQEADFEETLSMVREVQFAKVHVFPYSDRPGTLSSTFSNKIPSSVIGDRKKKLIDCADKIAFDLRNSYVGKEVEVLTEEGDAAHLFGHTKNFLPVRIERKGHTSNELLRCQVLNNSPEQLLGKCSGYVSAAPLDAALTGARSAFAVNSQRLFTKKSSEADDWAPQEEQAINSVNTYPSAQVIP